MFNVQDFVLFKSPIAMADGPHPEGETTLCDIPVPPMSKPQAEHVLDSRVQKQMRHGVYMEHLIKWHNLLEPEATWVAKSNFKRLGIDVTFPPPGGT